MSNRSPYSLRRVVGAGVGETLICLEAALPGPAVEILEIARTVLVDQAQVTLENVLLRGRLRVRYLYMALGSGTPPASLGTALPCEGGVTSCEGPVRALLAEAAFSLRIAVARAELAMECRLEEAYVVGAAVSPVAAGEAGLLLRVREQSLVRICLQVTAGVDLMAAPEAVSAQARGGAMPKLLGGSKAALCRFVTGPRCQ